MTQSAPVSELRPCLLLLLAALILLSQSASAQLHAAVLPTEVDLPKNRWVTFYATLLNESETVAQSCSITPELPQVFELVYVLTNPENNQPRSFKNAPHDIAPGTHLTYRIRLRTRSSRAVPGRQILFNFSCEGVEAPAKHSDLNRVTIRSIVDTPSLQDTLNDIGCVDENLLISSSESRCFNETTPDSLAVRKGFHATEYFLCYENESSEIGQMFLVVESAHGRSAHECSVSRRSDGCSVSGGRYSYRFGGDFSGSTKGGYYCLYPPSKESEDTQRILESLSKESGDYRYGEPFCDTERCFWERLDHSDLDELTTSF